MKKKNVDEAQTTARNVINDWLVAHKGIRRLICFGMVLVFLAMVFLALRLIGIYRMDHYATYAVNQMGFYETAGARRVSGFSSSVEQVSIVNDPKIEGCEQYATLTSSYVIFYDKPNGDRGHYTQEVEAYYAKFKSKNEAQIYLSAQNADNGRNRYVLGNYYFDFPREKDTAGVNKDEAYKIEQYNDAVFNVKSSDLLFTMILYRAFVVFDFSTGLEGDFISE